MNALALRGFNRWFARRGVIVAAALALFSPVLSVAHDAPTPEELAQVYRGVLSAIADVERQVEAVDDPAKTTAVENAYALAVLEFFRLHELEFKAEHPDMRIRLADEAAQRKAKTWARWFGGIVGQGARLTARGALHAGRSTLVVVNEILKRFYAPSLSRDTALLADLSKRIAGASTEVFSRHGVTYGVIWAVATATFEILEHGPIPIHVGCAAFQAAYHLVAQTVSTVARVGLNSAGDANVIRRLWSAVPANYFEWRIYWKLRYVLAKMPAKAVEDEIEERVGAHAAERYLAAANKFVKDLSFAKSLEQVIADGGSFTNVRSSVDDIARITDVSLTKRARVFLAQQQIVVLRTLLDTLREAIGHQRASLSFLEYVGIKRFLGTLGRLVDEYANALTASAVASRLDDVLAKRDAFRRQRTNILALLRDPALDAVFDGNTKLLTARRAALRGRVRDLRDDFANEMRKPSCAEALADEKVKTAS